MGHPLDRRRRQVDRHRKALSEDLGAQVRAVGRGQDLEAEAIPGEGVAVVP